MIQLDRLVMDMVEIFKDVTLPQDFKISEARDVDEAVRRALKVLQGEIKIRELNWREHYEQIFHDGGPWELGGLSGGRGDCVLIKNVDESLIYATGDGKRHRWVRTLNKKEHGYKKGLMLTVFIYAGEVIE